MLLINLWNYIRGYVIIIVTGSNIERFINICSKRNILLWDIRRKDSKSAFMKASIKGFKLMRPPARKSGCRVRILKKCGLPFSLNRFKRRKGFKIGVLIFFSLMVLSMSIIWDIEISGGNKEVIPQIMNVLNVNNIGRGSIKTKLDPKIIASNIALEVKEIAWVGVEIKGVKLYITFKDSISTPVLINNDESLNIIAKRDGIITKLEVHAGNALVKEGDTVKAGQVLVSGVIESQNPELGSREVHALGRVIARTWYESILPVSTVYTQRYKSGKTHKTTYLRFLDSRVKLPTKPLPFTMYDTVIEDRIITGPFGLKLPIGLTDETSSEIIEKQVGLTPEEAVAVAIEKAREDLQKRIPEDNRILDEVVKQVEGENYAAYIQVIIECEEDIAEFESEDNE